MVGGKLRYSNLIFMAMLIAGCGKMAAHKSVRLQSLSSSSRAASPNSTPAPALTPAPPAPLTKAEIEGAWKTGCRPSNDGEPCWWRATEVFSAISWNEYADIYSDAQCASVLYSLAFYGGYEMKSFSAIVPTATVVTSANGRVTMTPRSAAVAADWNQSGFCGISDWSASVERTVAPECAGVTSAPLQTFIRVIGNTMYFPNAEKTALDENLPYFKQ